MIRIAIADDDAAFLAKIEKYIQKYQKENGEDIQLTAFSDAKELIEGYSPVYEGFNAFLYFSFFTYSFNPFIRSIIPIPYWLYCFLTFYLTSLYNFDIVSIGTPSRYIFLSRFIFHITFN